MVKGEETLSLTSQEDRCGEGSQQVLRNLSLAQETRLVQ